MVGDVVPVDDSPPFQSLTGLTSPEAKTRRGGGDDDNFFSLCERRKFVALGGISFDSGDHFPSEN